MHCLGPTYCNRLLTQCPRHSANVPHPICRTQQVSAVVSASLGSSRLTVAALLDTAMLWQWGGPDSLTSTPMMAATQVQLASSAAPSTGLLLRQPAGAPVLQHGSRPLGFWNGAVSASW